MCQANTNDRIRALMGRLLNKEPAAITPQSRLEDLGADSLDRVEISIGLEDEFGITFDQDNEFVWDTVQDIFDAVKARHG